MKFKEDFLWGAATASYQVEGAALSRTEKDCPYGTYSVKNRDVF